MCFSTAFESVRTRGLVAFYSLRSIKAQTQLEIGECEKSSGVLLLCLVHMPVLVTADQIQNRNGLGFGGFFLRSSGTSVFPLGLVCSKENSLSIIQSSPCHFGSGIWYLPCSVWCLPFYFLPPLLLPSRKDVRTDYMTYGLDVRPDDLDPSVLGFCESCEGQVFLS